MLVLLHCENPNITPLSSPTMRASIFLLLVAGTAFAAATSCPEAPSVAPCTKETLLMVTECAMRTPFPKEAMKDVLVGGNGLLLTCYYLQWTNDFARQYYKCLGNGLHWYEEREMACGLKLTDDETKDCFDQRIQEGIAFCLKEY